MRVAFIASFCLALAAIPLLAATPEIGSVAAVNRDIEGTPPGAPTRSLIIGDRLITNERLVSSSRGSGQVLFLDQTTLTVSPNSDITLDRYVYDPEADRGELGVTVARGVLRVIGGRITKTTDAVIKTPTATIGIRGGIALIIVDADDVTRVMHIAGEYTRIETGADVLTLSRANALATAGQGGVEFNGVASDEEVGALYNQMQGGGGGTRETVTADAVEGSGVARENSDDPNAVVAPPISTAGETPQRDASAKIEQFTLSTDPDIKIVADVEAEKDVPSINPFEGFIGGAIFVSPGQLFLDDFGTQIFDAAGQNFLFAGEGQDFVSLRQGSLIGVLEDGDTLVLPLPETAGFFPINPADTASPAGALSGGGFADPGAGFLLYYLETGDGDIGVSLAAAPGPTQLRNINIDRPGSGNFRSTQFRILPDLHADPAPTSAPFLPPGLGSVFDNGQATDLFIVSEPNTPLFGSGFGATTDAGSRALLPMFRLNGQGQGQSFLLSVGASPVLNNGSDAPALTLFTSGSFRLGAGGTAFRVAQSIGSTNLQGPDGGQRSVFGKGDEYLLLGNDGTYFLGGAGEEATAASFVENVSDGFFDPFGSFHAAQRRGDEVLAPNTRIRIGATPAAYAAETGRTGAAAFGPGDARFLSLAYSSTSGVLVDNVGFSEKFLMRTQALSGGGAGFFSLRSPEGAMTLVGDETLGTSLIFGATLSFGGRRGAVLDDRRFAFREHQNPGLLGNVTQDSALGANVIDTAGGPRVGLAPDAAGETALRGALLSHGFADVQSLYPPNTPLTPQFLTWGWWTGQFRFEEDTTQPGDPLNDARLQFALGTWVAGNRTDILPAAGTATYVGPVTVNALLPNGADFVDGGRFSMTWDFAADAGAASFQDVLDLEPFTVPVSATNAIGVNDFGGDTIFGDNMTNARVDGSFFDGPNPNDARATAGSVRLDDALTGRLATGTFWGER